MQDDGEGKEVITGIHNEHAYRTLARISMMQMLNYIGCPDALDNAEWKNYTGKPRPKEKPHKDNGEWKKVPAHMEDMFVRHDPKVSKRVYDMLKGGKLLFPKDSISMPRRFYQETKYLVRRLPRTYTAITMICMKI